MSDTTKEHEKDISIFSHLLKDLLRFIKRKILKKYVYPGLLNTNSNANNLEEEPKIWNYYKTEEILNEDDIIYDIFNDNSFLSQIQQLYGSLKIVISSIDKNKKDIELLKKNIEVGNKKIKLLSDLNSQLNQYFNSSSGKFPFQKLNKKEINSSNKENIQSQLSLAKSFSILDDLKATILEMNNSEDNNKKDSNINIVDNYFNLNNEFFNNKNENIMKDEKIIKELPVKTKMKEENKSKRNNDLNIKKNILFNNSISKNSTNNIIPNVNNNHDIAKRKIINKSKTKNEEINEVEKNTINSLIDKIKIQASKKLNDKFINLNNDEKYLIVNNTNFINNKIDNVINSSNLNESKNIKYKNSSEKEFDKILKNEFSSIYSTQVNSESNNQIIKEIKNILIKIPSIRFTQNENKFENPTLIGTHKHVDTIYLLNSLPAIDILFKCKDIKNIEEINLISEEMMTKKLNVCYNEISKGYDKESEIIKVTNRCQIKVDFNYFFIYINLFYVNVTLSSYNKKENCINEYMLSKDIYNNKDKLLICLFFRRWRRKYKLFFVLPEFLDIIINFYYNENESIPSIIENIFYDLFNGEINFNSKNLNKENEKNINEIIGFIGEWYNIPEHKSILNNAIIDSNELISKNDYLSVVKND